MLLEKRYPVEPLASVLAHYILRQRHRDSSDKGNPACYKFLPDSFPWHRHQHGTPGYPSLRIDFLQSQILSYGIYPFISYPPQVESLERISFSPDCPPDRTRVFSEAKRVHFEGSPHDAVNLTVDAGITHLDSYDRSRFRTVQEPVWVSTRRRSSRSTPKNLQYSETVGSPHTVSGS